MQGGRDSRAKSSVLENLKLIYILTSNIYYEDNVLLLLFVR